MNQIIGEGRIMIRLKVLPDELWFDIDNPVNADAPTTGGPSQNGIGLRNIVQRLDLLYGSRYTQNLSGTEDRFHVTLKIPLS